MKRLLRVSGRSVLVWSYLLMSLINWNVFAAFAKTDSMVPDGPEEVEVKGAGIWWARDRKYLLSESHKIQLLQNLKQITGLRDLRFEENGQLCFGSFAEAQGGSVMARQILKRAIESGYVFFIEDHNESPLVNFGQMDEGTIYEDCRKQRQFLLWSIRLDFDDFRKMYAPNEVRESFSIGFTFLHELLHGLGHRDAKTVDEIGECEELVNQARLELALPTREQYFATQLKATYQFFTLRLRFRHHAQRKSQYLFFVVSSGGGLAD